MARESMSSDERVWAAIHLEEPDRVPVIPTLLAEPAAGLAGLTQAQVATDNRVAVETVFRVFDGYYNPCQGWIVRHPVVRSAVSDVHVVGKELDVWHVDRFYLDDSPVNGPG